MFPFCVDHLRELQSRERPRICAGAIVYDHAMREVRVECVERTGHKDEALCAGCRVKESVARQQRRWMLTQRCKECGQIVTSSSSRFQEQGQHPPTTRPGHTLQPWVPPRNDED